eukprot:4774929-Heterocapsa_arctica.AAC.1
MSDCVGLSAQLTIVLRRTLTVRHGSFEDLDEASRRDRHRLPLGLPTPPPVNGIVDGAVYPLYQVRMQGHTAISRPSSDPDVMLARFAQLLLNGDFESMLPFNCGPGKEAESFITHLRVG